jgi:hypothetical protein
MGLDTSVAERVGGGALEEGRLLQFHAQALFQRIVKHRIAGSVGEIGEHDRVFVGQKTALPGTPQNSNYDQSDKGCGDHAGCPYRESVNLIAGIPLTPSTATGAMKRLPRRGKVSIKRGRSAESPNASRSLLIEVLRLLSKSTNVSAVQI